jgi:hypothetical protein
MDPNFRELLSEFCEAKVEFLLVGAHAVAVHGLPRATGDLDVWIRSSSENSKRVWSALIKFGAPLSGIAEHDFQTPNTIFQMGRPPARVDVLTTLDSLEFDEAWTNRIEVEVEGLKIAVLSREHLLRNKRAVGRPQDLADVERLEKSRKDLRR